MRLDGQTALVTGGASGIGKATVLTLARSGASVICADVNEAGGAELVREAAAAGLAVEAVGIDLADPLSTRRTAAAVLARRGRRRHSRQWRRLGRDPAVRAKHSPT